MFDYAPRLQKFYTKAFEAPATFAHETLKLTPNQVSIISFALTMLGLGFIGFQRLEIGLVITLIGLLLDALDGSMARKYNMQTKTGFIFEVVLDGIHEVLLYPVMAYAGYVDWKFALATIPGIILLKIWKYKNWNVFEPGYKRVSPFLGYFFGFSFVLATVLVWVYAGIFIELMRKLDERIKMNETKRTPA